MFKQYKYTTTPDANYSPGLLLTDPVVKLNGFTESIRCLILKPINVLICDYSSCLKTAFQFTN